MLRRQLFDICRTEDVALNLFKPRSTMRRWFLWLRLCLTSSVVLIRCLPGCWRSALSSWRCSSVDCSTRLCALVVCRSLSSRRSYTSGRYSKRLVLTTPTWISNLSVISKLLERVMLRRLLEHLKVNDLLPSVQNCSPPFASVILRIDR